MNSLKKPPSTPPEYIPGPHGPLFVALLASMKSTPRVSESTRRKARLRLLLEVM